MPLIMKNNRSGNMVQPRSEVRTEQCVINLASNKNDYFRSLLELNDPLDLGTDSHLEAVSTTYYQNYSHKVVAVRLHVYFIHRYGLNEDEPLSNSLLTESWQVSIIRKSVLSRWKVSD
jgi:hypothetical protein